jgi:hypothetical protein
MIESHEVNEHSIGSTHRRRVECPAGSRDLRNREGYLDEAE